MVQQSHKSPSDLGFQKTYFSATKWPKSTWKLKKFGTEQVQPWSLMENKHTSNIDQNSEPLVIHDVQHYISSESAWSLTSKPDFTQCVWKYMLHYYISRVCKREPSDHNQCSAQPLNFLQTWVMLVALLIGSACMWQIISGYTGYYYINMVWLFCDKHAVFLGVIDHW